MLELEIFRYVPSLCGLPGSCHSSQPSQTHHPDTTAPTFGLVVLAEQKTVLNWRKDNIAYLHSPILVLWGEEADLILGDSAKPKAGRITLLPRILFA